MNTFWLVDEWTKKGLLWKKWNTSHPFPSYAHQELKSANISSSNYEFWKFKVTSEYWKTLSRLDKSTSTDFNSVKNTDKQSNVNHWKIKKDLFSNEWSTSYFKANYSTNSINKNIPEINNKESIHNKESISNEKSSSNIWKINVPKDTDSKKYSYDKESSYSKENTIEYNEINVINNENESVWNKNIEEITVNDIIGWRKEGGTAQNVNVKENNFFNKKKSKLFDDSEKSKLKSKKTTVFFKVNKYIE